MMQAVTEFLHMGGYGAYVWSSFGLSAVILLVAYVLPVLHERNILNGIRKRASKEEKAK